MDDDQRETESERPAARSGQVRISGAETARRRAEAGEPEEGTLGGEPPARPSGDAAPGESPPMQHWTEAPTGQVPAVLSRGAAGGEWDPWSSLPEPTWREEHSDWAAGERTFEPSMLSFEKEQLGSLGGDDPVDRQPWAFDLGSDDPWTGPGVGAGEVTRPVSRRPGGVTPAAPAGDRGEISGGARSGALFTTGDDEDESDWSASPWSTADTAEEPSPAGAGAAAGDETAVIRATRPDAGAAGPPDEADEPGSPRVAGREPAAPSGVGAAAGNGAPTRHRLHVPHKALVISSGVRRASPGEATAAQGSVGAGQVSGAPDGGDGPRSGRNIPLAVVSGLVVGAIVLILFHFGTVPAMVVATVGIALAAAEAFAAFRRGGYHPATLLGLVAVAALMVATYTKGQQALPLVLVLLVAFCFLWHLARVDRRADPVRSTAATLLVFCWVGGFGSFAALLLAPSLFPHRHGIAFLLGALITAVAYDVGALAVGAWVGRRPLSSVSPKKTWEGLLGGTVAAVLAAVVVVHFIHPWTIGKAALLGLVVAVVSPLGDLGESLVKRHLGLKDMGRILPGHGGFLDRIDGVLFVLPATYYLVRAFHLG